MSDLSTLRTKINDLKAKIENDSISPIYLGTILNEMLDGISDLDEEISDAIRQILEAAAKIAGTIDISDIDSITTGSAMASVIGSGPFIYNVTDNNRIVGQLLVISDDMAHVYTQVFVTHRTIDDAGQLTNYHTDTETYIYSRSFGISSTASIPQGQWTPWKKMQSELVQEKGQSEKVAMSQKAVTDELNALDEGLKTLRANTVMAVEVDEETGAVSLIYDEDNKTISDAYIDESGQITIITEI